MTAMPHGFSLRSVPEEWRRRYRREGLWTDETLGVLIDGEAFGADGWYASGDIGVLLRETLRAEHATRAVR